MAEKVNEMNITLNTEDIEDKLSNLTEKVNNVLGGIGKEISSFSASGEEFIGTISNIADRVSLFTDGMGVLTSAYSLAGSGGQLFSTAIASLGGPVGAAITAIGALGIAIYTLYDKYHEPTAHEAFMDMQEKKSAAIDIELEKWNKLISVKQNEMNSSLAQIDHVSSLVGELKKLADVNGVVSEGYEGRANFILGELNSALGTEYKLVDGVIQNYDGLSTSLDTNIEKKRAKIIIDSQEGVYEEALIKRKEALIDLSELEAQKTEKNNEIKRLSNELSKTTDMNERGLLQGRLNQLDNEVIKISENYNKRKKVVESSTIAITEFENNYALFASGNAEDLAKINNDITQSNMDKNASTLASLGETITAEQEQLSSINEIYKNSEDEKVQTQVNATQLRIDNAVNEGIAAIEQQGINNENELAVVDEMILAKQERNAKLAESEDGLRSEEYIKNQEQIQRLKEAKKMYNEELIVDTDNLNAALKGKSQEEKLNTLTTLDEQCNQGIDRYQSFIGDKVSRANQLREELAQNYDADKAAELKSLETQQVQGLSQYGSYVMSKLDRAQYLKEHMKDKNSGITKDMVEEAKSQAEKALTEYGKVADNVTSNWDDLEPETRTAFENMMKPMMSEMENKRKPLWEKASEIAGGILDNLKKAFDIHSPSRKVRKIFNNVMEGAELGLEDETPDLLKQSKTLSTRVLDVFTKVKQADVKGLVAKMQSAINLENLQMKGNINSSYASELFASGMLKVEMPELNATIKGKIENHIMMDGRETAVQLTPFISEELAFNTK